MGVATVALWLTDILVIQLFPIVRNEFGIGTMFSPVPCSSRFSSLWWPWRCMLEGTATLDEVGEEIYRLTLEVAAGAVTRSESLGHREFILTYKSADALGTLCGMEMR
jgi:hypothetical protein